MKRFLITGVAGFIGYHLCARLIDDGHSVVGIDSLNDYYDVELKEYRLKRLQSKGKLFTFYKISIEDESLERVFEKHDFDIVINLAAQAGVRYSLENPSAYIQSNIVGFSNLIELSKKYSINKFIYASSSSVYGGNEVVPFSEKDRVDRPVSLYAATKRTNELIAYTYSHLFGMTTLGLRFFTVYGPMGRPDMAYFSFTKSILRAEAINVYDMENMKRDFTYIDDVVEAIKRLIEHVTQEKINSYQILNVGNSNPEKLADLIKVIEESCEKKALLRYLPKQAGDVNTTFADSKKLETLIAFKPRTSLKEGISKFVDWYRDYYNE